METLTEVFLIPVKYYLPTIGASNENHHLLCLHVNELLCHVRNEY